MSEIPEHIFAAERKYKEEKEAMRQMEIEEKKRIEKETKEYHILLARITKQFQKQFEESMVRNILSHNESPIKIVNKDSFQVNFYESKVKKSVSIYTIYYRTVQDSKTHDISIRDKSSHIGNKFNTGNNHPHDSPITLTMENLINYMNDRKIKYVFVSDEIKT